jgi:hypothetical protein
VKQTSFLDHVPTQTHYAAPARHSDPATSVQAAEELNLADAEEVALEAAVVLMNLATDFTANELGNYGSKIVGERGKQYSAETIRKRYTGLLEKGLIALTGETRKCLITGKNAQTYRTVKGTTCDSSS